MKINNIAKAVKELEVRLLKANDISYDGIDILMRNIMKSHDLTAKELHYGFKNKHHKTPDDWIKMKRNLNEDHKEIKSGRMKDDEGYMARVELDSIDKAVNHLRKAIKKGDQQLPAWVQSKITKAADYIDTAAEYLASNESVNEASSFEINPDAHKKARPKPGTKSIINVATSDLPNIKNSEVLTRKTVLLPKLKESTVVERILSSLNEDEGCSCDDKDTKPVMSIGSIAKKHKVSVEDIKAQLKMGIKVEREHTTDRNDAKNIALQHLAELPDYYTKLKKVEKVQTESTIVTDLLGNPKFEFIDLIKPDKLQESGTLHHWFKGSKSKNGKPGWVQADGSPCANEEGEKSTPKCFSSGRLEALKEKGKEGEKIINSAVRRKRKYDKEQQEKTGGASPTNVKTFAKGKKDRNYVKAEPSLKESLEIQEASKDRPGKGSGQKDACYQKVKSRYRVFPSAYACVPENSTKSLTKEGWKTVNELRIGEEILTFNLEKDELEFKPILDIHRYKNVKTNVIQSDDSGFVFECTDNHKWVVNSLDQKVSSESLNVMSLLETKDLLEKNTNKRLVISAPYKGEIPEVEQLDDFILSEFLNGGFVTWESTKGKKTYEFDYTSNNRVKDTTNLKLVEEKETDVWCPETENNTWVMWQETDGKGIITITGNSGALVKCRKVGAANWGNSKVEEATLPVQNGQVMQILFSWRGKMMASQLFFPQIRIPSRKEVSYAITQVYPEAKVLSYKVASQNVGQPLIQIPNSHSKNYLLQNKTIGEDVEYFDEAGPSLSVGRGEKLPVSRGGGLTAKGRAKYNRATGSNLKAPVTGKVKRGSKAWKRRKNFCSRSRSWKGPRGLAARRRWRC
jgi:hypothetical protein